MDCGRDSRADDCTTPAPTALQVCVPVLLLLAAAIWSNDIDRILQRHPQSTKALLDQIAGWTLAALVIAKIWSAAISWSRMDRRLTRRYLLLWTGMTLALIGFAILASPPME